MAKTGIKFTNVQKKNFGASKVCFSVYLKFYLHLIYIEFIKNLLLKILILTEQVYTKSKILAKQVAWFYSKLTKRIHPSRQRPPEPFTVLHLQDLLYYTKMSRVLNLHLYSSLSAVFVKI